MTDDLRFERNARDWLELGPVEAPADVIQAALFEIDTTPQERDFRIPWRFQTMPTFARAFLAAAVIVGLVAGGALFAGSAVAPPPSPTPSPTASSAPSPTTPADTDLSARFVSDRYGYAVCPWARAGPRCRRP